MHIGISGANLGCGASSEGAIATAQRAEELGVESLWTADHILMPARETTAYPYSADGHFKGAHAPVAEAFVWLAHVVARTTTVRLGTAVLVLPQRQPALVAKQAATLAHLSGGRLVLGVGVGWWREEFEAVGAAFACRGDRCEDYIAALRALWADGPASYSGEFVTVEDAWMEPGPPERTVPIVVGGHSSAAARRAGRFGDGFFPAADTQEELRDAISTCREAAACAGRDPDVLEITTNLPAGADEGTLETYHRLGVDRVLVARRGRTIDDTLQWLESLTDSIAFATELR